MTTPIVREAGTNVAITGANAIATSTYANAADKLRIQNTNNWLLADFRLTGVTFGAAPVQGSLQIAKVPRDFAGNPGPVPVNASMVPLQVYTLGPTPGAGNAATGWVMSADAVPLDPDADYWLYNNNTAQTLAAGWTLTAQPWSPGT
jgi:hypothetical protein